MLSDSQFLLQFLVLQLRQWKAQKGSDATELLELLTAHVHAGEDEGLQTGSRGVESAGVLGFSCQVGKRDPLLCTQAASAQV